MAQKQFPNLQKRMEPNVWIIMKNKYLFLQISWRRKEKTFVDPLCTINFESGSVLCEKTSCPSRRTAVNKRDVDNEFM
jgi:hypothetical protein